MPRFSYVSDRLYLVKWVAEELSLHAANEKEAKAIAAEYLQSDEHMQVQLMERIPDATPRA